VVDGVLQADGPRHIIQAALHPVALDNNQAEAVEARCEIDLRTGAAFTRALTMNLKSMIQTVQPDLKVLSYGQFPLLQGRLLKDQAPASFRP
jgi:DNA topoisomerase-3